MLKPVLEYGFSNRTDAIRHRIQCAELRLHVGWKCGKRSRAHIDRVRPLTVHVDFDPVISAGHFRPGFAELYQHGLDGVR